MILTVRMIRSKREYRCTKCGWKAIKWQGICEGCSEGGTLEEVTLIQTPVKPRETTDQKKLRRRSKNSEREIARQMLQVDGPDPAFEKITSSTGRVGHITGMRIDAISLTYVTENKNRKLPLWLIKAWVLINQKSHDYNKNALLHVEPPNMPKEIVASGNTIKLDTMAIITQKRHEELIREEKVLRALGEALKTDDLETIRNLYWELTRI